MKVDRLDHLVLTVRSVRSTCEFYAKVLGITAVTFGALGPMTSVYIRDPDLNLVEISRYEREGA
jgi:predicted enzyme related to lactoylglutathione lyase